MTANICKICGGQLSVFLTDLFDERHGCPGRFDIHRCGQCGFGQTFPEYSSTQIGELYTTYYPRRSLDIVKMNKTTVRMPSRFMRWWLGINNTAHYHTKKGNRVLDVGCGDCTSLREINALGGMGHGIEPDRNVSEVARTLNLSVHIGLFDEIPYPIKSFDLVTMSQVLEHIHEPVALFHRLSAVLKDNGRIIIGVPNIDSRLSKHYGARWLNWHVPYHISHFSRKSLEKLAKMTGLRILSIKTITPNLWDELQQRLLNYPVAEGEKIPFLNGEAAPISAALGRGKAVQRLRVLFKRLFDAIKRRFNFFSIASLRLNDAFGHGESFLVILQKDTRS